MRCTRCSALVICLVLVVCTGSCDRTGGAEGDVVTLRYWNMFTGPDGRTMLRLVQKFNQQNPDVRVVMQRMEQGTYYNKLFVAGLGGRAPEVFVTHRFALQRFVGAGFVQPAETMLGNEADQIDPADIDANVLEAMKHNGRYWGVPLDVHPLGMFYNRKLLKDVGFVDAAGNARPPTNREEFMEVLRRLRPRPGVSPGDSTWGFVFTWQRINCYALMKQFGGNLFDEGGSQATFAAPGNVEALSWAASLVRDGLAPGPQDFDSWIGFRQGRVGVVFHGIFMLPELKRQQDLDWGAAPMPVLGERPATWGDSHSLVLRKDLDEKHLAAAKRFIKFLSDNSLDWAEGGQVPVRKSLRDSERFRQMYAQSEFAKQIPYVEYFPPAPFVFEYLDYFDAAIELALRGTRPADGALAAAGASVQQVIERYRKQEFWNTLAAGPEAGEDDTLARPEASAEAKVVGGAP
jgi:multiple sugar transport system substrate-binding protein